MEEDKFNFTQSQIRKLAHAMANDVDLRKFLKSLYPLAVSILEKLLT